MKQWIEEEMGKAGRDFAKRIHAESQKLAGTAQQNRALSTMLQEMTLKAAADEGPRTHVFNS